MADDKSAWQCRSQESLSVKFPCSPGGDREEPGQLRSQGTLGTVSGRRVTPLKPQRESTAYLTPVAPGWLLVALCLSLVITFPQGWLQASLPNFLSGGCQVLDHCCVVREVRKTAWSLQGLFPKFSFLDQSPGKTAKSSRESSLAVCYLLALPLSLSPPLFLCFSLSSLCLSVCVCACVHACTHMCRLEASLHSPCF